MDKKEKMAYWSECTICETWIPDSEGSSYWGEDGKVATYIICDSCLKDERDFKLVNDFAVHGIEYEAYGERLIQYTIEDLLKKFAPKSSKRYRCLSLDLHASIDADDFMRVEENNRHWYIR